MVASRADTVAGDTGIDAAALRARLVPPMPGSRFWGWLGPLLVTAFGTFLRFNRLSVPHAVIFDETYYVPDALGILRFGVEHNYIANRNALIARGDPHIFSPGGEFVVHPPFGKILIAGGEWAFGLTPFGWRFAVAVAGSLSILIPARIARRMTRSTLLGCVAGLLLALDGLEFVMSRTALLDIFVMFWVLAAFGCLVIDRDRTRTGWPRRRSRPARRATARGAAAAGGALVRWCGRGVPRAGLRIEVERHLVRAGVRRADRGLGCRRPAGGRPAPFRPRADGRGAARRRRAAGHLHRVSTYLAAWSGWLSTSSGYDRQWAAQHGIHTPVISAAGVAVRVPQGDARLQHRAHHPPPLRVQAVDLAGDLPAGLVLLARPTPGPPGLQGGLAQEVLAIGTPADLVDVRHHPAVSAWAGGWRAGTGGPAPCCWAVAAGWLPWFLFAARTQFYFYAVAFVPFLVLSITLCLGLLIGPARGSAGAARRPAPPWPARTCWRCCSTSPTCTRYCRPRSSPTPSGSPACGTTAGSDPASTAGRDARSRRAGVLAGWASR